MNFIKLDELKEIIAILGYDYSKRDIYNRDGNITNYKISLFKRDLTNSIAENLCLNIKWSIEYINDDIDITSLSVYKDDISGNIEKQLLIEDRYDDILIIKGDYYYYKSGVTEDVSYVTKIENIKELVINYYLSLIEEPFLELKREILLKYIFNDTSIKI